MINGIEYITIATDASCSDKRFPRGTGFAYYIRTDKTTIKHAWYEKDNLNSSMAEAKCFAAALNHVLDIFEWKIPENSKLIANIDSDFVANMIKINFSQKVATNYSAEIALILELLSNFKDYDIRVLKSHKYDGTRKNYMNRLCDRNARRQLRTKGKAKIENSIPDPR